MKYTEAGLRLRYLCPDRIADTSSGCRPLDSGRFIERLVAAGKVGPRVCLSVEERRDSDVPVGR